MLRPFDKVLLITIGVAIGLIVAAYSPLGVPMFALELKTAPRERILFNDHWCFCQGDPREVTQDRPLSYEALKPWIEATGNEFSNSHVPSPMPAGDPGAHAAFVRTDYDDSTWRAVDLPHDWAIEGPFKQSYEGATGKLKYWGPVWYRKHFKTETLNANEKIFLQIDGAMSHAVVWLNGHFVGGWPYGYTSFQLDLTPYISATQDNVISIRLNSPMESSRWYPGGGIYRNVWLLKTKPIHVAQWGTFVTTPSVSQSSATANIKTKVDNDTASDTTVSVKHEIYELEDNGERGAIQATDVEEKLIVKAKSNLTADRSITIKNPRLWSLAQPNRYVAVTSIEANGQLMDVYETPFGVRTIKFDAKQGFFLNDQRVKLNGVCNHHDLGALGTAVNVRALERQLEVMKEFGCNAIRTSHNPPAPELLDLCDKHGFLVMDESFDCWVEAKRPGDYHQLFADWHEKDLRAGIRRDRNHPCVILWSIGNEIAEQEGESGHAVARQLVSIVHEEDRTRPVTAGCHNDKAGYNGFQKILDVLGYNYKPWEYKKFHEQNPTVPVFGSETASCVSSRGEYFFRISTDQSQGKCDFQVNSFDWSAPPWATTPDTEFKGQDENPCVAGEFVWTGFDYLGEPTPYDSNSDSMLPFTDPELKRSAEQQFNESGKILVPSRSSYFGIVDLAGFKKDRFYAYQAEWRPELPMVHIFPHWTWPERLGQVTPVYAYTSGDAVELFLNGKSLGRKNKGSQQSKSSVDSDKQEKKSSTDQLYKLHWDDVVYEPGEIKAVAYKKGRPWAEAVVKTAGQASALQLEPDRTQIIGDGKDLSFITLSINDAAGRLAPRSKNPIKFTVDGPGEIVATDNGDATDFTDFRSHERQAFNGLCLVIVRATKPGSITIHAHSANSDKDGLTAAATTITASQ